jgi:tRNA(Ile)-lysidine synthase
LTHYPLNADESLIPHNETVLAAVSSGGDSMSLLLWLIQNRQNFVVAHVHHDLHELRNGECDRDERFVREVCEKHSVRYLHRKIDLERRNGHVNEAIAREGRYAALIEMALECGASRVATAHSANDLLETALLGLMRGAGLGSRNGFLPSRPLLDENDTKISLVRPFWKIERQELRRFLQENGWEWREDESNFSEYFRRNRVRHEVLPLLETISGQSVENIAIAFAKNSSIAHEENSFLEISARKALETIVCKREPQLLSLDGNALRELPIALQRRILRLAALEIAPTLRDLNFEKVEQVRLAALNQAKRRVWNWRGNLFVEWTGAGSGNRLRFWLV